MADPWVRILSPLSAFTTLSQKMLVVEPYLTEGILAICSAWACYMLLVPPTMFVMYPNSFYLARLLQGNEMFWAILAVFGAISKLGGLILTGMRRWVDAAFLMRCLGLAISGLFWTVMGISTVAAGHSLFGPPGLAMALRAWWTLLRVPAVPPSEHMT